MKYKKRREKAGITFSTMVKELGIPENKYKEVEEGKRSLEGNMLDKFMNILNRKKEVEFNQEEKLQEIDKWVKSGQIYKDMKEYGYTSQNKLADAVNTSQSVISCFLRNDERRPIGKDKKIKIYDFLHDPLNKCIKEEKAIDKKTLKYIDWFQKNTKEMIEKNGLNQKELAKIIGCSPTHLCRMLKGESEINGSLAKNTYDYFINKKQPNITNKKEEKVENKSKYIDWFINNIKDELSNYNMTQKQLSEICKCDVSNINHIINGASKPSEKLAKRAYNYFNNLKKDKEEMLGKTDNKKAEKEIKKEENKNDNIKEIDNLKTQLLEKEMILIKQSHKIIKLKRQIMLYEKLIERL